MTGDSTTPKSALPILLVFFALIVVVNAIKGYRTGGKAKDGPHRPLSPQEGDALVLVQLKEAGSDLSKPHSMEFFLYLPTKEAAEKAADQIRSKGFGVKVEQADQGANWRCLATKWMVPDFATIESIRTDFDQVARSLGGKYDGWGTPTVS